MDTEKNSEPVQQENQMTEKQDWVDTVIDIFKKLLELSNFSYGTKKNF